MDRAMSFVTRLVGSVSVVVSLGALIVTTSGPGSAQSTALEVTSDTPEYCGRLRDRLTGLLHASPNPPPAEVARLSADGQHLCDNGQTRAGILRLRRAWLLMTQKAPSDPSRDPEASRQQAGGTPQEAVPTR